MNRGLSLPPDAKGVPYPESLLLRGKRNILNYLALLKNALLTRSGFLDKVGGAGPAVRLPQGLPRGRSKRGSSRRPVTEHGC
jgi:hypothetical protein